MVPNSMLDDMKKLPFQSFDKKSTGSPTKPNFQRRKTIVATAYSSFAKQFDINPYRGMAPGKAIEALKRDV